MSLKIYFVRHGQSEANLRDDFYDDSEARLTRFGKEQANELGAKLKDLNVKFSAIYCSTYKRAIETCEIALEPANNINCKIYYDERLIERQFDGLFGRNITHEQYVELCDYNSNLSEKLGIETLPQVENRARSIIDELKEKYNEGNILVFSHGIFGLVIQSVLCGYPKSGNIYDLELLKNCEIKIFDILK